MANTPLTRHQTRFRSGCGSTRLPSIGKRLVCHLWESPIVAAVSAATTPIARKQSTKPYGVKTFIPASRVSQTACHTTKYCPSTQSGSYLRLKKKNAEKLPSGYTMNTKSTVKSIYIQWTRKLLQGFIQWTRRTYVKGIYNTTETKIQGI